MQALSLIFTENSRWSLMIRVLAFFNFIIGAFFLFTTFTVIFGLTPNAFKTEIRMIAVMNALISGFLCVSAYRVVCQAKIRYRNILLVALTLLTVPLHIETVFSLLNNADSNWLDRNLGVLWTFWVVINFWCFLGAGGTSYFNARDKDAHSS